jgi:hypothetical protein
MDARPALAALALAALLAAPPASAQDPVDEALAALDAAVHDADGAATCLLQDPDCPPVGSPMACLLQPVIPETPAYYIVWACATGGAVAEPVGALTGCTVDVQGVVQCVPEALAALTAVVAGLPDAVACLLGPHIPETFAYYIAWSCLFGGAIPEPVQALTGCTLQFGGHVEC